MGGTTCTHILVPFKSHNRVEMFTISGGGIPGGGTTPTESEFPINAHLNWLCMKYSSSCSTYLEVLRVASFLAAPCEVPSSWEGAHRQGGGEEKFRQGASCQGGHVSYLREGDLEKP